MRTAIGRSLAACAGVAIAVTFPGLISAQVPTRSSEPRLAVPRTEAVAQPTAQPTAAPEASAPTAATSPDTTPPNAPVTQVTGGTGVTKLGTGAPQTTSSSQYAASDSRSYTAGRFALVIERASVGWVKSLEGGNLVGEVRIDASGGGVGAKKQLASTKVEEISAVVGMGTDKSFLDWIAQSWKGDYQRKSGSIVLGDFNFKSVAQRDFSDALITETTVPKLDGSSKDPAYFTVKIQPQSVRSSKGDGASMKDAASAAIKQKGWLASNFRFDMDGLDATQVATIESFTVRQPAARDVGEVRETKGSGGIEFPNLKLSISQARSSTWWDWYNDFVVNGQNDDQREKNGAIVFLGPDMKAELGRIKLLNCGIFRLADDGMEANSDKIKRLTAELYCERMEFAVGEKAG
jgi:tail tube protein gp19